jgi:Pregnancy-associated plasma protein-A
MQLRYGFMICFICNLIPNSLAQQSTCGFDQICIDQQDLIARLEREMAEKGNKLLQARNENIVIPIVFHVVWRTQTENVSDERLMEQIYVLNRDFNGLNADTTQIPSAFKELKGQAGFTFCLAEGTTNIRRYQTEITDVGLSQSLYEIAPAYDPAHCLNIWIANTSKFISGFGTFPSLVPPSNDGVVLHPSFIGFNLSNQYKYGRVAVHEVGHYFGLLHPWGDGDECLSDDGVTDTPTQSTPYYGCTDHPQISCEEEDVFMTFMDYGDDPCLYLFTTGQIAKMRLSIELYRSGFMLNTQVCLSAYPIEVQHVLPNPVDENLTLIISGVNAAKGLTSFKHISGQTFDLPFDADQNLPNVFHVNTSSLADGFYYLVALNDFPVPAEKIVVAH